RPGTTESGTDNPSVNTSDATGNEALDSPAWLTARRSGPHSRETTLTGRSPTVTIAVPGLPATMPASVLIGTERIELQERPVPVPEPTEVLVEVGSVGVCGSDVHYYRHGRIGDHVMTGPLVLGHELGGRIAAVGTAVDEARIGERVAVEPQRPCRACLQCKAGRYNLCPDMRFYAT